MARHARIAAVLVAAATLGACAREQPRPVERLALRSPGPALSAPALALGGAVVTVIDERTELLVRRIERASARRRHAELRRLRRSRSVRGALRRAWLAGEIDRAQHDRYRRAMRRARRMRTRLPAARGAELGAVVATAEALAARRLLRPGRVRPMFLTLERNLAFWTRRPFPRPAQRFTFGRDPVVFQYYPGQGLQIQMLASFGVANGMARTCLDPRRTCRRRALRAALDRLVGLASRRGDYMAWESFFRFGTGAPPWVSGMTQGTAVQALARGARALGRRAYLRVARRALGAFEHAPPLGVSVPGQDGGRQYLMYSFAPGMRILNGFLQAVTGLHDMAALSGSHRAQRLFARGERAARAAVRFYDTGAWSLYSAHGSESSLGYHELVRGFLGNLCRRTRRGAYCVTARRFGRYLRQPPRIGVAPLRRWRVGRRAVIGFSLSKVAHVTVVVVDRRRARTLRRVVLRTELDLPRGAHAVGWTPLRRGRYDVRIAATGLSGPRGIAKRAVRVAPRHRHRKSRRRDDRARGAGRFSQGG